MRVSNKLTTAMRSVKTRREKGIMGSMMLISLILIMVSLLSLSIDYSHLVAVRAQLRNAADAAALAGAQQLWTNPDSCGSYAYNVCQQNLADGLYLTNENSVVTVNTQTVPPSGANLGTVTVTINMLLKDLVSPIFGRFTDHVQVIAVAGAAGDVKQTYENILFPIAVSKDQTPGTGSTSNNGNAVANNSNGNGGGNGGGNSGNAGGNGGGNGNGAGTGGSGTSGNGKSPDPGTTLSMKSLIDAINGDKSFTIYLNNQQFKNAAFTSFTDHPTNSNWVTDAIAQCLGVSGNHYDPVTIPSVEIGVDNIYLNNGMIDQRKLGEDPFYSKMLEEGRNLVLPVIEGAPAYNQNRRCIGFIVVHPVAIHKTQGTGNVESIDVIIKDAAVPGISGTILSSGDPAWDSAYAKVKPHTVKLLL